MRSWAGDPYRVTIPVGKSGLIRGNVFLHSHPRGESFSAEDVWILLRHGAREVRVCGPSRSFRMMAARTHGAVRELSIRYRFAYTEI